MAWYHIPGALQDVAVCTRVRLSRNLSDVPFRPDAASAREMISRVAAVLEKNGFNRMDHADMSRATAYAMVEQQYTSPAFVRESLPHALFLNEPCNLAVTVCTESHITIQAIYTGLSLQDATDGVMKAEALLDEAFSFAFDEHWGYLSRSPEDLGTGLRASVLLCLPMLEAMGRIEGMSERLAQTGAILHRLRGVGGTAAGSLYRLSNRATLGVSEEETVTALEEAARRLCESERHLRDTVSGVEAERLQDRICRAAATLRGAKLISTEEMTSLLTDLRLGAAMGVLHEVKVEAVTTALIESMPATLTLMSEVEPRDEHERERRRAEIATALEEPIRSPK